MLPEWWIKFNILSFMSVLLSNPRKTTADSVVNSIKPPGFHMWFMIMYFQVYGCLGLVFCINVYTNNISWICEIQSKMQSGLRNNPWFELYCVFDSICLGYTCRKSCLVCCIFVTCAAFIVELQRGNLNANGLQFLKNWPEDFCLTSFTGLNTPSVRWMIFWISIGIY